VIRTRGLTRRFGEKTAVDALDCELGPGRIVALLGANGAGKTTTINMLTTLLAPSAGSAEVGGHDVVAHGDGVRRIIGYVPEHGAVYEGLTADEYLDLAATVREMDPAEARARIDHHLELFELTAERGHRLGTFSKGMRRKVLVTAALLHRPEVLFLDEPMDGLDVRSQKLLGDLLRAEADRGCLVLYSSHILQQVEELCEEVVLIHEGRLKFQGGMADLRAAHAGAGLRDIFLALTEDGA
jgi:ABC-2 type transport system ATP-binding protein